MGEGGVVKSRVRGRGVGGGVVGGAGQNFDAHRKAPIFTRRTFLVANMILLKKDR